VNADEGVSSAAAGAAAPPEPTAAREARTGSGSSAAREATAQELEDWDRLTVDVEGGQVLQSRAWAVHRARSGWQAHHLVCPDGRAVLALSRPWPVIGGSRAYLPRGPVSVGDSAERVAERLTAVTSWLAARGVDGVTSDAELPVASGYGERLATLGWRRVEEVQPARHRLSLRIDGGDEDGVLAGVSKQTRQRIRRAEEAGLTIRRFDALAGVEPGPGFATGPDAELDDALRAFYRLVQATGERRGFKLGPLGPFLAWHTAAHAAGHAIHLEASPAGEAGAVAGLLLYRQGDRLSTVISGDDAAARSRHPGALHLLRWRAIQLAIRERRTEMDLGGVDVAGARHEPRPGESMYGLYEHKRSFGAAFVEQVGAHERVLRPVHHAIALVAARISGAVRA
jgi:lipid II:glycine glycyltransferase (peptidoglycan interpeptide bridge formation enzyme)